MRHLAIVLLLFVPTAPLAGADTTAGDRAINAYFRSETDRLADRCLADIRTLEDWKTRRNEYREQLFEMLGLSPPVSYTHLTLPTTPYV